MGEKDNLSKQFDRLLKDAQRILVTSHISPDPDAISSILLFGTSIKLNYPEKKVWLVSEEKLPEVNFLQGYDQIHFKSLADSLNEFTPDTFVLLDGNNFDRCSRHEGDRVRKYIEANKLKVIMIDHHELSGRDDADLLINNWLPATVQEVFNICFDKLGWQKPDGYAQTAMLGLYSDTGGLVYLKEGYQSQTLTFAERLVGDGANIEQIKHLLGQYNDDDMRVLKEIISNISHGPDYTYSFLKDNFIERWVKEGKVYSDLKRGVSIFLDDFIRNISGRKWGFLAFKNTLQGENFYTVSLRAEGNAKDVSQIANLLGGGGHKPAAGAKFQAKNVEEAISKVKIAIQESVN